MKAIYSPKSGFSDHTPPKEKVTILGFVFGQYEPGYSTRRSQPSTLAIIALETGAIIECELQFLKYLGDQTTNNDDGERGE